ncbi:hypothetical protein ACO1O0_001812 [Amphichorda felina]
MEAWTRQQAQRRETASQPPESEERDDQPPTRPSPVHQPAPAPVRAPTLTLRPDPQTSTPSGIVKPKKTVLDPARFPDRINRAADVYDGLSAAWVTPEKTLFVEALSWLADMPRTTGQYVANHPLTSKVMPGGFTWVLVYALLLLYGDHKIGSSNLVSDVRTWFGWVVSLTTMPPEGNLRALGMERPPPSQKRKREKGAAGGAINVQKDNPGRVLPPGDPRQKLQMVTCPPTREGDDEEDDACFIVPSKRAEETPYPRHHSRKPTKPDLIRADTRQMGGSTGGRQAPSDVTHPKTQMSEGRRRLVEDVSKLGQDVVEIRTTTQAWRDAIHSGHEDHQRLAECHHQLQGRVTGLIQDNDAMRKTVTALQTRTDSSERRARKAESEVLALRQRVDRLEDVILEVAGRTMGPAELVRPARTHPADVAPSREEGIPGIGQPGIAFGELVEGDDWTEADI